MAIVEQQTVHPTTEPKPASRLSVPAWPRPSQFQRSLPVFRLLAKLWAVPQVSKVGVANDDDGIEVRVLIREEDRPARSAIYAAQRDYLSETPPHSFQLWVSSAAKVGDEILPPYETVLER
jgi:hypothetical protein